MSSLLYARFWLLIVLCELLPHLTGVLYEDRSEYDTSTGEDMSAANSRDTEELPVSGEIFEGDIVMDNRFRRILTGAASKKSALTPYGFVNIKWPGGIIFYEFDWSFNLVSRFLLAKAFFQFEKRTCIRFKKRTKEEDYVVFSSQRQGCSSLIGRVGGGQVVNLEKKCLRLGTFEHEIMHALGLIHEHSRPDRDKFLKVNYANIRNDDLTNFGKYAYYETEDLGEDFNFASVMLYPNDAFSKNGHNTIEAKGDSGLKFGQRRQFSVGDVRQVNKFYNCKKYLANPVYDGLVKNYHLNKNSKRGEKPSKGFFDKLAGFFQWLLQDIQLIFLF